MAWELFLDEELQKHYNTFITMPSFSRGLRPFTPQGEFVCLRCRTFSTTAKVQSGHNRWSKIKHDKGAADMKKNVLRSQFSKEITLASKRTVRLFL